MLSLKYIRIRNERPAEQRLSSIWRDACADFGIPCVLIYLDEKTAYISASLKHLPEAETVVPYTAEIQEKLQAIQRQYTNNEKGYWQHNVCYHTFDAIPVADARAAGSLIFETLAAYLPKHY